ncbi:hypothetical protein KKH30_03155 [Candidatus Micrarchaeota archaeon]|nr:hypothetical protein [Candidatus Micrarchaeota archaeon]MBU1939734.1 hypothetical protein [Candidatus Micrarchaeota archaeon]
MGLNIDARGQAAVTDAMYFLAIVTALCVFLFMFSTGYGSSASDQMARQHYAEYTTSALKTVLYSSTARVAGESIYDDKTEKDHLLAYIKEEYAESGALNKEVRNVLYGNIAAIMAPVSDQFDYIFYIVQDEKFIYVLMHVSDLGAKKDGKISADAVLHRDYYCGFSSPNNSLVGKIGALKSGVGDTYQSSSKIKLPLNSGGASANLGADATLLMWAAADLTDVFDKSGGENGWNCTLVENYEDLKEESD